MTPDQTPPWVDPHWLMTIPERVERCSERWGLTVGERLGHGMTSRVFACADRSGRAVILKLAPAEMRPDLEAEALATWDGRGSVRLIDIELRAGALLLERLVPGTALPPGHDASAVELVAAPLMALHATPLPPGHPFPSELDYLEIWLDRVRRSAEAGTAGLGLLDHARRAAIRLSSGAFVPVLLHGDFIDKNLLRSGDAYVSVDPLPHLGDPCSDVGFYAAYHPPAGGIVSRARSLAVRCGLDPERAARWAAVRAIGEATETWRHDSDELQAWAASAEAANMLDAV